MNQNLFRFTLALLTFFLAMTGCGLLAPGLRPERETLGAPAAVVSTGIRPGPPLLGGIPPPTAPQLDGNPVNENRGRQAILLGPANSAIVEFIIPEKGRYMMMDHDLGHAHAGATGIIEANP